MPIEVAQLRPEGVDAAIEFAKSAGCELKAKTVDPSVSLIARDDEAIVATVLGVHLPGGACELHVCLSKLDDPGTLIGDLLNKALMKVHGAGTRRCQIHHHGPEDTPVNWLGAKWTGQIETETEKASGVEAEPETGVEVGVDSGVDSGVDDEASSEAELAVETAVVAESETETAPEVEAEAEVKADANSEAEPQADAKADVKAA